MPFLLQLLGCFLLLAGCDVPPDLKAHINVDCQIFTYEGKLLRQYPGNLCLFFDDGSYLSAHKDKLKKFDRYGNLQWEKEEVVHHELTFDQSKKYILYISSEDRLFMGHLTRFDIITMMDFEGKVLRRYRLYDHKEDILKKSDVNFKNGPWFAPSDFFKTPYEFSHINSIQEVPVNKLSDELAAFAPGNFIVSFNGLGLIVVLDHDLKNILWSRKDPQKIMFSSHSAEVTPQGHVIFFNNTNRENAHFFSSIDEIDPRTNKLIWQLRLSEIGLDLNPYWGAVQWIDQKTVLITENSKRGRMAFIDKDNKKIVHQVFNYTRLKKNQHRYFWYRGRYLNLSSFLKNSLL